MDTVQEKPDLQHFKKSATGACPPLPSPTMEFLYIILLICVTILSAIGVWLNLPGSFLMALFVGVWAWVSDFSWISVYELSVIVLIVMGVEILEFLLGGLAVRLTGAESKSAVYAILGGVAGTILLGSVFFVVGALVGLFAGSYLGAYWGELQAGKSRADARRAAMAALLGNIAAKVLKTATVLVIGIWMFRELW